MSDTARISVRINKELTRKIDKEALLSDVDRSTVIRSIIELHYKASEEDSDESIQDKVSLDEPVVG